MSDFKAKMHQIRFQLWLRPRSRYSAPLDPLSVFKGPNSKAKEGRGREVGGKGRGGRGGKGKG